MRREDNWLRASNVINAVSNTALKLMVARKHLGTFELIFLQHKKKCSIWGPFKPFYTWEITQSVTGLTKGAVLWSHIIPRSFLAHVDETVQMVESSLRACTSSFDIRVCKDVCENVLIWKLFVFFWLWVTKFDQSIMLSVLQMKRIIILELSKELI